MKRVGIYVAIAAAWAITYVVKDTFGISDTTISIGILMMMLVIIAFNVETRLQTLETRVVHKEFSGVIAQIHGELHVPKHRPPESLIAGGAVASRIRPEHETLFEDFRWFAMFLNEDVGCPWVIEELPTTDVGAYDGPEAGRSYDVWYNACKVGKIQISLAGNWYFSGVNYTAGNLTARLALDLNHLRFIPYRDARRLLKELVVMIKFFDRDGTKAANAMASTLAVNALNEYLWEAVRTPELVPIFNFEIEGPYNYLRDQNDRMNEEDSP
jgi:hypothetical protein